MKHYNTNLLESVTLMREASDAMKMEITDRVLWVLEIDEGPVVNAKLYGPWHAMVKDFIFEDPDNGRAAARHLLKWLTPGEFRQCVAVKTWYKSVMKDIKYRSPRFWTRQGDCLIVNLNKERAVCFIDAHTWVE